MCVFFFSDELQLSWIYYRFSKFSCVTQHMFRTQVVANLKLFHLPLVDLASVLVILHISFLVVQSPWLFQFAKE